jgi:hypothetical protein
LISVAAAVGGLELEVELELELGVEEAGAGALVVDFVLLEPHAVARSARTGRSTRTDVFLMAAPYDRGPLGSPMKASGDRRARPVAFYVWVLLVLAQLG